MIFYQLDTHKSEFNDDGYFMFQSSGKRKLGESPRCPVCSCKVGILPWLPPYNVRIKGDFPGDIIAGCGRSFLISNRLADALYAADLAHFEILDAVNVTNRGKRTNIDGQYKHILPPTVVTRMDESATPFRIHQLVGCDHCRTASRIEVQGLRVDEATWKGDHFFYPSGLFGRLLVTEPVANLLRGIGLKNVHLVHQDDYREYWER